MNHKGTRYVGSLTLSLCLCVIFTHATAYAAGEQKPVAGQDVGKPVPPAPCTITLAKKTQFAQGTGFSFSSAWSGLQGITLDNAQSISKPVPCGPIFNVFETPKAGWTLTNIACSLTGGTGNFDISGATTAATNGFEPGDNQVNFSGLSPGTSLQCTFTNAAPPPCTLTVKKKTIPAGGTGFSFSSAALPGGTLSDGQSLSSPVPCGPIYNMLETPKPGWALTNIACVFAPGTGSIHLIGATTGATDAFQLGDNEVNFDSLTPGSSLKCTFTNKRTKKIDDPSTKGM